MFKRFFAYPQPLWKLYSGVAFLIMIASVVVWGGLVFILSAFGLPRKPETWCIRAWCRFICWLYQIHFDVRGRENHKAGEPSLVVSNHQSLFDIPAFFISLDGDIRAVAKKELFSIPIFGHVIRKTEFIPIDRGNRGSGQRASDMISKRIHSGLHIWVAPEGTRSVGADLLPFKKGSFAVAISARIPIQPILVENSFEACPKKAILARPGTVIRVDVLPRISTEGYTLPERGALAEHVRSVMKAELEKSLKTRT